MIGWGLSAPAMLRWALNGIPSDHWLARPTSTVSSKPSVMIRPSLGPFRSISLFMASVVE